MANNGEPGNRHACAACKHQRRKCSPACVFPPYFPGNMSEVFESVLKVFGVSNLSKLLRSLAPPDREEAVKSILWESELWEKDPVHGPLGSHRRLEQEFESLKNQNQQLMEQLRVISQQQVLPYATDSGLIGLRTGERDPRIMSNCIADANNAMYYSNVFQDSSFTPREEMKSQGINCAVPHYVAIGQGQERVIGGRDIASNISSTNSSVTMEDGRLIRVSQGTGYANSYNAAYRPHQGTNYRGITNSGHGTSHDYNGRHKGIINNNSFGHGRDKVDGYIPTSYQDVSQVRGYTPCSHFTQRRETGQNNDALIVQQQQQQQQLVYSQSNTNHTHSTQDQNNGVKHDKEHVPTTG